MFVCSRCRTAVDPKDCYCRHCGKSLQPRMGFWYDHGGILLLTLVIGPFSLIPLWISRKLTLKSKGLWTGGIVLISAYLAYALYRSFLLFKEAASLLFSAGM